tara:strand:+ start:1489 stop:1623 length:135 start_codon:yes stop_codon:yes gene_type:complete
MDNNVKGMLFTAGAVVVGIVVAGIVTTKLMPKAATVAAADEGDE